MTAEFLQFFCSNQTVRDGKCSRNAMRTSIRSTQIRNVGDIFPKINSPINNNWNSPCLDLRILKTNPHIPRTIAGDSISGSRLRVRPNPPNLRLRSELSDSKIYAIAEHSCAERVHIRSHINPPRSGELDRRVQNWVRVIGGIIGIEYFLVDNCYWSVYLHRKK